MTEKKQTLKEGDVVVICDPGSPNQAWDGASCVVVDPHTGNRGQYVRVKAILEIGGVEGTNVFHPETVQIETRPWLKRHIKEFMKMRRDLLSAASKIVDEFGD